MVVDRVRVTYLLTYLLTARRRPHYNPRQWVYRLGRDSVLEQGLRVTGHRVNDSGRVGSGRVMGQCDRPGVSPSCSFCTRFIVAYGETVRHLCEIAVVLK